MHTHCNVCDVRAVIGRDGGANPERARPGPQQPTPSLIRFVLKQMSLLREISYLFNSKNASAEHLIELDEVICLSVRSAY